VAGHLVPLHPPLQTSRLICVYTYMLERAPPAVAVVLHAGLVCTLGTHDQKAVQQLQPESSYQHIFHLIDKYIKQDCPAKTWWKI
jgi:hypothetical protein